MRSCNSTLPSIFTACSRATLAITHMYLVYREEKRETNMIEKLEGMRPFGRRGINWKIILK
jgi:hypothetical protein